MLMRLLVIDEFGEIEKVLGCVSKKEIQKIIGIAEQHDLTCLQFVDIAGDTYFNDGQLLEIQKEELPVLEQEPEIDKNLLLMIKDGTNRAQGVFIYLKFEDMETGEMAKA